jgi:hypothetical protein
VSSSPTLCNTTCNAAWDITDEILGQLQSNPSLLLKRLFSSPKLVVSQKPANGKVSRLKLLSLPSDFYFCFVQVVALFARDHHKNIKRITRPANLLLAAEFRELF